MLLTTDGKYHATFSVIKYYCDKLEFKLGLQLPEDLRDQKIPFRSLS